MLGFFGIVLQKNTIANTAQIIQEIKPGEKYLVSFLNPPPVMRVCNIEEIQMWLLFPDKAAGDAWVAANQQQQMELDPTIRPPAGNGADTPESDTEVSAGSGETLDDMIDEAIDETLGAEQGGGDVAKN